VQIQPVFPGDERECHLDILPQFVDGAGFTWVVAGSLNPAAGQGRVWCLSTAPIRADGERLYQVILQSIGYRKQTAHRSLLDVEPIPAGRVESAIGTIATHWRVSPPAESPGNFPACACSPETHSEASI
jgi:hypothetical protein